MKFLFAAAFLLPFLAGAAFASDCKGLDQAACTSNAACRFVPAHKAGDLSPRTSKPYARDMRAFCRIGTVVRSAKTN